MRAAQFTGYGAPDVLAVQEVPDVVPGPGEMLVRVRATTVNAHDVFVRSGAMRIVTGRDFPLGIGVDFAGEVLAPAVGPFQPGARVWGTLPGFAHPRSGAAADLVAVSLVQVSLMPAGLGFTDAAAIVAGGTATLTALRDNARLRAGERVLVRGGTGAVGNVAVQYAKSVGAHVTALTSERSLELARTLGAHVVLDHRAARTADLGHFDVILDTVGTHLRSFRRLLAPRGRMVSVAVSSLPAITAVLTSVVHGPRRVRTFLGRPQQQLLRDLSRLTEAGSIRPLVDTVHPLTDIGKAHQAYERGGSQGKHILEVS